MAKRKLLPFTVYVQMRVWSPESKKLVHVPKRTVKFRGFTPDEVFQLITEAGRVAQERAQKEQAK